jgi:hypothetical protein
MLKRGGRIDDDDLVVQRLADVTGQMPGEAVDGLSMISDAARHRSGSRAWDDHARALRRVALHSTNEAASRAAEAGVNRLGAMGHQSFRDLVVSS